MGDLISKDDFSRSIQFFEQMKRRKIIPLFFFPKRSFKNCKRKELKMTMILKFLFPTYYLRGSQVPSKAKLNQWCNDVQGTSKRSVRKRTP